MGVLVPREVIGAIFRSTSVDNKLISARPHNVTILQGYAPTSKHEMEEFCQKVEKVIKAVPKKDTLVVLSVWNIRVGPDTYHQRAETEGKFGLGEAKDRGLRLL